jgi:Fe2+ transport system protein B
MNAFKEDNIDKKVSNMTHQKDTDIYMHSFTPMLDTLQNLNNKNDSNIADSTCTRFVRKKFMCIILFLVTIMVIMNFFTTVTEKLSQENVQDIYGTMVQVIKKILPNAKNGTNIERSDGTEG